MTRVLVTGATGFLGRAVSGHLEAGGTTVSRADVRAADGVRAVDITSTHDLDDALSTPTDAIIHLAAAGTGDSGLAAGAADDPARAIRTNIEGFAQVVRAAARHGVSRVLWSSSTTIYGPAANYQEPIDECADLRPNTVYGATKAACEFLGPMLGAEHGIDVVSLRLPMVYGPGRWYGGSQRSLVEMVRAIEADEPYTIEASRQTPTGSMSATRPRHSRRCCAFRRRAAPITSWATAVHWQISHMRSPPRRRASRCVNDRAELQTSRLSDVSFRNATGWQPTFPSAASGAADYRRAVARSKATKGEQ